MGIITRGNMLMAYLKDLANIYGRMEASIKEILSKDLEVAMEFGVFPKPRIANDIKVITVWIKNQDTEYINGKMDGHIKEILIMITEMDMESFTTEVNAYTEGSGIMDNRQKIKK